MSSNLVIQIARFTFGHFLPKLKFENAADNGIRLLSMNMIIGLNQSSGFTSYVTETF
jgi:hypothetical protein